jgi:hypothetical protein
MSTNASHTEASGFAPDPVTVTVEIVRVGGAHGEVHGGDVATVKVRGWRWDALHRQQTNPAGRFERRTGGLYPIDSATWIGPPGRTPAPNLVAGGPTLSSQWKVHAQLTPSPRFPSVARPILGESRPGGGVRVRGSDPLLSLRRPRRATCRTPNPVFFLWCASTYSHHESEAFSNLLMV